MLSGSSENVSPLGWKYPADFIGRSRTFIVLCWIDQSRCQSVRTSNGKPINPSIPRDIRRYFWISNRQNLVGMCNIIRLQWLFMCRLVSLFPVCYYSWLLVSTAGGWIIMTGVPNLWTDRCYFSYLFQTGATALFLAAQGGYLDIARALLRAGSRVNAQCNVMSLLFITCYVYTTTVIRFLSDGGTALMVAAQHGYLDVCRELLNNGANIYLQMKVHCSNKLSFAWHCLAEMQTNGIRSIALEATDKKELR